MLHLFQKKSIIKWPLIIIAIFFIIILLIIGIYFIFEKKFAARIYPGVFIANIDMSGKTKEQAQSLLNQKIDQIKQNGIIFQHEQLKAILFPVISSVEGDLAYQIIRFDAENNIQQAFNVGREKNLKENLKEKYQTWKFKKIFPLTFHTNDEEISNFIIEKFNKFKKPSQNAKLAHNNSEYLDSIKFNIEEEQYGQVINYKDGLDQLKQNLSVLNESPIELSIDSRGPEIIKSECIDIEEKAKNILAKTPLNLEYNKYIWTINFRILKDWLILKVNPKATSTEDKIIVGLDTEKVKEVLLNLISSEIDQEPLNAKFEIKNGRVIEFQDSRDGRKLKIEETIKKIEDELIFNGNKNIELVIQELKSELHTEDINDFGIKEIIGTGHSNFSGSPENRRHNIKTGANAVNGALIKPGEEFSLIKTLGDINKETGYLPELVIKDNKTIPEYGGGLCQIGTTVFRATIKSGLPVTLRRNHSYRVSYYEPAGTDATIYDPWPDYRFINDTKNHILIQTRIEGDDIYFDFWGTRDGRKIKITDPVISNITKPEPTKIIETLDLPVGTKKCTEHAHNGADAYFDYTVTYTDNTEKYERFTSHYVPWREVCLLGVEKLSTATSSEELLRETVE
ncbi:hypothetical protein A2331_05560 [Candidatus Falkowbacteria bacterium RIFOXYB2_FULL_34_18]|uniref:YoaR-like putative peptidoglycan binding domain-containing protein n=1 Tax=Candidatus Falkowbacteria bacterium RIFOXYD2_FULL_34_120 TaxID=1798007 RepID=A0A1F5TRG2_9BACT|nr:MAG: hypothetical protein A2331_05560 [Candidatus Falkowbacteria bacterium RIFOXYB2_FULL_34_18]OGF29825.1 MAG: hypothetical protein A2500_01470 [Candidatus Falkowbacteria bacterium RIFOXYC12_FULL_34_55]OGF37060.1 MAG: hypothetical protein A2466_05735 [Candidatus Falkowbacteria bacterium RIFOXYC2_FULL_34_220]OGF39252.1 MAG: hypothetical protein A2515_00945 [Candidatus Falkowbacteria bacterium RIFOXYD12_FULL_34_57]OGF41357.1 MAG: hypothetical protein A2531_07155 [Candidatus Falkowbacteria bact